MLQILPQNDWSDACRGRKARAKKKQDQRQAGSADKATGKVTLPQLRPCVTNFFFAKALLKRLWKLSIKTKRLSRLKSLSFLNFNN